MRPISKIFTLAMILAAFSLSSCTDSAKEENVTPDSKEKYQVSNKANLKEGDMVLLTWTDDRSVMNFVKVNPDATLDPNMMEKSEATLMRTHVVGDNRYAFENEGSYIHHEGETVVMSTEMTKASVYMLDRDNSLVTANSSAAMWVREGIIIIGGEYNIIDKRKVIVITEA